MLACPDAMALHHYLSPDRLAAIAQGRDLPEQARGSVLFADVCGFTSWSEALARREGERAGVEALSVAMGDLYDRLIDAVDGYGGNTVVFAGDAITCWFDSGDDVSRLAGAPARAVAAALAMQAALPPAADGASPLALKVSVASGTAQRLAVGDPALQLLDLLAGAAPARVARADRLAQASDVLVDEATARALGAPEFARRVATDARLGDAAFVVLDPAWRGPLPPPPSQPADSTQPQPDATLLQPWLLPFVRERELRGRGLFATDLRPVVAVFVRLDYAGGPELDEAAVQRLRAQIRKVQAAVHAEGGALLELGANETGCSLYAAFGAARASEDDTQRAMRAALAVAATEAAGIGVASGMLRVGGYGGRRRQSFGAQGDAVNFAARLMAQARPGEVLASARVRAAVADAFEFEARPPIALKGKAEPMPVFSLLGPSRQRPFRLAEPDMALPIVGRERELAELEEALSRAARGEGSVALVVADAGMGKSRLVAEVMRRGQRIGFACCGGTVAGAAAAAPYQAWHGVVAALLQLDPGAGPRLQARRVQAAVAHLAPEHREAWPLLGPALGLDLDDNAFTRTLSARDRKALREAVVPELLAGAAHEAALDGSGLLLVLEDLHAADTLSLELLAAVAERVAGLPVLLLLSQRPPLGEGDPDVRALLERPARAGVEGPRLLHLEPGALASEQVEQLVRAKLGALLPEHAGRVPRALIERVTERAQGNPFCAEELLNDLRDRGLDPLQESSVAALQWPLGLRRLVLARIDRLGRPLQNVLKLASVIGREFGLDELQACHPETPSAGDLRVELDELSRLGLLVPASAPPIVREAHDERFGFRHAVLLEVAYESIAQASRQHLHERVARHLEAGGSAVAASAAPQLAHHWARAQRPDRAWPHLLRSAEQAAAGFANEQALAAYDQVLAWLPDDALAQRIEVLWRCEALHDLRADHAARRRVLSELERLAGADGFAQGPRAHKALQREILLKRAALALDTGDFAAATRDAEAALEAAGSDDEPGAADVARDFEALLLLSWAAFEVGRNAEARAALERARELAARHGLATGEARALSGLALVEWQSGRFAEAERLLLAALPALRAEAELRRELDALTNLGVVAKARARFGQAIAYFEQAQAIARRIGDRSGEAALLNNLGGAALDAGDFHRAATEAERAARIWTTLDEPGQLAAALCNRGEAHRELGQYAASRSVGERALALARAAGVRRIEAIVLENLGRVAAAQGDALQARLRYDEALAVARDTGVRAIEASTLLDIGRLQTDCGALDDALATLAAAAASMDELGDTLGAHEVCAARAEWLLRAAPEDPAAHADAARAAVDAMRPLLPRLLAPGIDEPAPGIGLYATAWRALDAAGDARAAGLLERARSELRTRAAHITDPSMRRDFLQVHAHRLLLADELAAAAGNTR